ncbi:hypothetical protein, partial [Neobacillus sp.]|uniref:hypothetical protein n=1 Tax=Neobacillus sp. TaxID=2675273 RepID=UPI0028A14043
QGNGGDRRLYLGNCSIGDEELYLKERVSFPEDPSGPGQRGRSGPASLGYCSTGGEELYLKECGQIRKTRQSIQGNGGDRGLHLGNCSTGSEELQLKERVCFRKTRRGQSNTGDQSAVRSYRKRKSADQCPYHNLRRQKFYMKRGC